MAKFGKGLDPNAGSPELLPQFGTQSGFQMDYLTKPNFWWELGIDLGKLDLAQRVKDTDRLLIAAYPYFNIQGEGTRNHRDGGVGETGSTHRAEKRGCRGRKLGEVIKPKIVRTAQSYFQVMSWRAACLSAAAIFQATAV